MKLPRISSFPESPLPAPEMRKQSFHFYNYTEKERLYYSITTQKRNHQKTHRYNLLSSNHLSSNEELLLKRKSNAIFPVILLKQQSLNLQ